MTILLDTNIVIYLQKGMLLDSLPIAQYAISVITEMELRSYPAITESQEQSLNSLINDIQVIGLTDAIKEQAIKLRKEHLLKLPDAVICATAITEQAVLLTNDKRLHEKGSIRIAEDFDEPLGDDFWLG